MLSVAAISIYHHSELFRIQIYESCTMERATLLKKLHDGACDFDFLKEMRRKMGEGAGRWKRLGEGSEPLPSSVRSP